MCLGLIDQSIPRRVVFYHLLAGSTILLPLAILAILFDPTLSPRHKETIALTGVIFVLLTIAAFGSG